MIDESQTMPGIKRIVSEDLKLHELSCFQRILLTTDGTVTEILEQYLLEKIRPLKIDEKIESDMRCIHAPHRKLLPDGSSGPVLERRVLLQGVTTLRYWIQADSTIFLNQLSDQFLNDLLRSEEPIGRLWEKYRVETFKEVVHICREPATEWASYFTISPQEFLIARSYLVYSGGCLVMMISERFPESFFQK